MKIVPLPRTGSSAKYNVQTKRGDFMLSLSRTLYEQKWELHTEASQQEAASRMAEAIVGRHNPKLPFESKYIFADHNTEDTLDAMVAYLHKHEV